jgi:5-methylcytosine-specific restriction endonuclease McrA
LSGRGGGYRRVKSTIQELELDTSHWARKGKQGRRPRWSDDELRAAVANAKSLNEAARELGAGNGGNPWRSVKRRVEELDLDVSHWLGLSQSPPQKITRPIEEVFVVDSPYSPRVFKRILLEEELLPVCCALCNITEWRALPLSLQIDHINGAKGDWRLENLRWLCPNCHSQTETWGRNIGSAKRPSVKKPNAQRYFDQAAAGLQPHRAAPRKWTPDELLTVVPETVNLTQVCHRLGLRPIEDNYTLIAEWITHLDLDIDHWTHSARKPLEELIERSRLRWRLVEEGHLEEKCYDCGIRDWMRKSLVVQLHHKNGKGKDNRLENLTFLCPNCHSQTDSFAGRNVGKSKDVLVV